MERFSNDDAVDIVETQKHFRSVLPDDQIQYLVQDPFLIHLFTKKQIEIFKLFKHNNIVLNIDATGSLIKKPPTCDKPIYYYALTLQHPVYCTSPVPVAEMISSDHGTGITHFLNKWVLTCKAVLHKDLKIGHIEMDHSWAIMHSTWLTFNRLSISLYLTQCWEIVNNKTTIKSDIPTVLHLCLPHIMHRISYRLDKINKLDKVKRIVLHSFGTMVKSNNIEEISLVFESLCILLNTELMLHEVIKSLVDLEKFVKGNFEIKYSENFYIDDYPDDAEGNTYRKTSPLFLYFEYFVKWLKCKFK